MFEDIILYYVEGQGRRRAPSRYESKLVHELVPQALVEEEKVVKRWQ